MKVQLNRFLERIGTFARNPYLQLFVGIILIVSRSKETAETFSEDVATGTLRVAHGTLLLGITHFLRTLPDVVEGLERATDLTQAQENKKPNDNMQ